LRARRESHVLAPQRLAIEPNAFDIDHAERAELRDLKVSSSIVRLATSRAALIFPLKTTTAPIPPLPARLRERRDKVIAGTTVSGSEAAR
jgi:hypothetical protein